MAALTEVKEILGGMGVGVSNAFLVNEFCKVAEKLGVRVMGTVSLTAIGAVAARRLQLGDERMLPALKAFPVPEIAEEIAKKYFVKGGKKNHEPFSDIPMFTIQPSKDLQWLTIFGSFAENWLAKQNHDQLVSSNLLEKIQMPILWSMLGAMWTGDSCFSVGAGLPLQIPNVIDAIMNGGEISYRLDVAGSVASDDYRMTLDLKDLLEGVSPASRRRVECIMSNLSRSYFVPIVTLNGTDKIITSKTKGRVDGRIYERRRAGGHNAPPRGWKGELDDNGEPVYGPRDEINYAELAKLDPEKEPFWLAGGVSSDEEADAAKNCGARGMQRGTCYALAKGSGIAERYAAWARKEGYYGRLIVLSNPRVSPTGFPFQTVEMPESLSRYHVLEGRKRVCDLGYLKQLYKRGDGTVGYRCPAENIQNYVRKGGKVEDTVGRGCICNALFSVIDMPQIRHMGDNIYEEPPIFTLGQDLGFLKCLMKHEDDSYSVETALKFNLGLM